MERSGTKACRCGRSFAGDAKKMRSRRRGRGMRTLGKDGKTSPRDKEALPDGIFCFENEDL